MSRTVRNYAQENGRDGVRKEKLLKLDDVYTGYVGEESHSPEAKKRNKKIVTKHNRRLSNIISDMENQNE